MPSKAVKRGVLVSAVRSVGSVVRTETFRRARQLDIRANKSAELGPKFRPGHEVATRTLEWNSLSLR